MMPLVAKHWEHRFNHMVQWYNEIFWEQMTNITPHVCRYIYCSIQAKAGIYPKTLQYPGDRLDRWGAIQMTQDLEDMGFTVVPFGQGYKEMFPLTKEFYKLLMERKDPARRASGDALDVWKRCSRH